MGINDILHKNNPIQKKIDRENRSDFAKLVDRNTELVDEIKWLKADNEILNKRIDHVQEYIDLLNKKYCKTKMIDISTLKEIIDMLKGEFYE